MLRLSSHRLVNFSAIAVILLISYLLISDFYLLDTDAIGGDASQNVRSALNLAKHGVYSEFQISEVVAPGYRREPFPNFLLAIYLRLAEMFQAGFLSQVKNPFSDSFLLFLKTINLVWSAALFLGIWLCSRLIYAPMYAANFLAAAQILVVNQFFVVKQISRMNTELIASAVLIWLSVALLQATRQKSWRWILPAGAVFGLMALTKSSAAYVALLILPVIAFSLSGLSKRFWSFLLAFLLGFSIVVGPWLIRNQVHFSRFAIAKGGGDVLLIRSVFNQMSPQELRDSFYAYSPKVVRRDLLGPLTGLSDKDFSCDGKLAVFNRDLECDRVALKQKRYEDVRSFYQIGKRALPYQLSLSEDGQKAHALQQFKANPLSVVTTSFPLAWRGCWGFRALYWKGGVLNAIAFTALFLAPVLSLIQRRISWLMVSIVPVSLFAFYALVSHFLPRYSLLIVPSSIICLFMLLVNVFNYLFSLLQSGKPEPVRLT